MPFLLPLLVCAPFQDPGSAGSEPVPGELPAAAEILRARAARIGGPPEGSLPLPSSARGRCEWIGLAGGGELRELAGDLGEYASTTEYEAFGRFLTGSDGELVWEESPLGVTLREGWEACQYLRMFEIPRGTPWERLYAEARTVGLEELDGLPCWRLALVPRALVPMPPEEASAPQAEDVWFVERDSGLLRRALIRAGSAASAEPPSEIRLDLGDWRAVDGVLHPFRQEVRISGFALSVRYAAIEHGAQPEEGAFEPGAAVREALEERHSGAAAERDRAIVVEEQEERQLASIRMEVAHADLQKTLAVLLPEIMQYVLSQGVAMDGQPLVRYHAFGERVDVEAAIPVRDPVEGEGRVRPSTLPAGPAAVAWHVGPYDELGRTYERLQAFLGEQELVPTGPPWEEYWTDPGLEPDPSRWRTRIVWPVRGKE